MSHPPIELDDGWPFSDLELDVVRYADGSLVVQDEHEFANACRGGYIDEVEAALAEAAFVNAMGMLKAARAPFDQLGWHRLADLTRSQDALHRTRPN
ncbi:MAG: DUF402 domain-containing protein [Actinomycetota bacterium]|nr:DUF402 domain-containing protein [Actinomycetota bacterium]